MFDLEKSIAAWRHYLQHKRTFNSDDLDELEQHLRDEIAALKASHYSDKAAFEEAMRQMGDFTIAEQEYEKVFWNKAIRRRAFLSEIGARASIVANYSKIALRTLFKQKGYTFINVVGLATGLAVCALIALFVHHEWSYDRFHEHADRLYRVVRAEQYLQTSAALAPALEKDFPEVVRAVRISPRFPEVLVTLDGVSQYEKGFYFTDSTFLDVFSFPLLAGNPSTALSRPFTLILTESMARKYFNHENPIGRTLRLKGYWDDHDYEITGIVQDPPSNSHLSFNFIISVATRYAVEPSPENLASWRHVGDLTYVRLTESSAVSALTAQMPAFYRRHIAEAFGDRALTDLTDFYTFQPITAIHLYSHLDGELAPNSEVRYLYIFATIALLILLIACINFVNLTMARSAQRAREVGVRKVVGARRGQLVYQFLLESVTLVLAAVLLAFGFIAISLPAFNELAGTDISLQSGGRIWFLIPIAGITVGMLAGLYPALVLSRIKATHVLKRLLGKDISRGVLYRGLVVAQFAVSVALIIGTLTIQQQLDFFQEKRLGLNPDQVIVLSTRNELGVGGYEAFKAELLKQKQISGVTASSPAFPANDFDLLQHYLPDPSDEEKNISALAVSVGMDFLETLEIPLIQGRDFQPADLDLIRAKEYTPVIVNQAAVQRFGWSEPIGEGFKCCMSPPTRVVGVMADFHFQSLKEEIKPLVIQPTWWSRFILVRVSAGDLRETLAYIEAQWKVFAPEYPFEYHFLDDRFASIYSAEERLARIFGIFSALSVMIACLGLFGLAAFAAEKRTKEIGIRKVLGATAGNIVLMLTRDFTRLVAVGMIVAAPVAYLTMNRWLEDFAYHIDIGPGIFLATGTATLVIAVLTVIYQALKASFSNPVDTLRYE